MDPNAPSCRALLAKWRALLMTLPEAPPRLWSMVATDTTACAARSATSALAAFGIARREPVPSMSRQHPEPPPMKRYSIHLALVLLGTAVLAASAGDLDWPQYLGPRRNSTSDQKGLLRSWPTNGPEVLWTVPVGKGYGGPVVKDGKVYLLDRDDKVGDKLRCLDLSTGKELWKFAYDAPGTVMFPGSRSVPTVDGNHVYSCGHNGDLYCIDINTHKPVWNKNVWKDFGGGRIPMWAITQCPLVYGDLLIVASQAPEAGVVAYEKAHRQREMENAVAWPDQLCQPGHRQDGRKRPCGHGHFIHQSLPADKPG